MNEFAQDLRFGWRALRKNPVFTAVALITIALGIGSNAAIFSYIDGSLLRPLPYANADRMVRVGERLPNGRINRFSAMAFQDLVRDQTIFESLSAQRWTLATMTGLRESIQVAVERVSLPFFDIFTARPLLGRLFLAGEDQPGHDHVAVISHVFWVSQLAADPHIIGQAITLDDESYTVIGVMGPGTFDRTGTRIWRPLVFSPEELNRNRRSLNAWAVLRPGVALGQARAQMAAFGAKLAHDFPETSKDWTVGVDSFASILVADDVKLSLYVLMAAVAMVLLIACTNLANLLLARGAAREREVAIRASLGAGRWRLIRQFLTESILLSFGGGMLGVGVAFGGLQWLKTAVPGHFLPPAAYVEMDGRVLGFIMVLALLTGIGFGLYPALKASKPNLTEALKQGGSGASSGRSGTRARGALVCAEVALAFVLLTGAGLLIHSFFKLLGVETGFDSGNVVTAHLTVSRRQFPSGPLLYAHLEQLKARIEAIPGVSEVSLTSALPMEGWGWGVRFEVPGHQSGDPNSRPGCYFKMVSPSYARALGLRLVQGRFLGTSDVHGSMPVVVINQTMAQSYFKGQNPLGQRILAENVPYNSDVDSAPVPWEIVGVVANEKLRGLSEEGDQSPGVYVSIAQSIQPFQSLIVRTATDPRPVMRDLPRAIREVDPNEVATDIRTLDELKADTVEDERIRTTLLSIFAAIAIALSAVGLYGVIAFTVAQRTRELGIRTALGAPPGHIRWQVLRRGLALTGVGLAIGVLASLALSRVLTSMLFEVPLFDPVTEGSAVGLVALMALAACLLPARRATRISPLAALRTD